MTTATISKKQLRALLDAAKNSSDPSVQAIADKLRPDEPKRKVRRRKIQPLTKKEFRALLAAAPGPDPKNETVGGLRDAALLALLGGAGLRLSEALALEVQDVDTRTGKITVHHGKGDKERHVFCAPSCMAVVNKWLKKRAGVLETSDGLVICNFSGRAQGKPYLQQHADRMMKRLAEDIGIKKRVHPHGFRHSMTMWMAEEGVPIHIIKQQLGHASLRTTDHYVTKLSPEQLRASLSKFDV